MRENHKIVLTLDDLKSAVAEYLCLNGSVCSVPDDARWTVIQGFKGDPNAPDAIVIRWGDATEEEVKG